MIYYNIIKAAAASPSGGALQAARTLQAPRPSLTKDPQLSFILCLKLVFSSHKGRPSFRGSFSCS